MCRLVLRTSPGCSVAPELRAFLAMARAAAPGKQRGPPGDAPVCVRCGEAYLLDDGKAPSPECHPCAQEVLADVRRALARLERVSGIGRRR